jgi:hypothetical protein
MSGYQEGGGFYRNVRNESEWPKGPRFAVFITRKGSEKERGMSDLIKMGRYRDLTLLAYPNQADTEYKYNHKLDYMPGLIAVAKVLQAVPTLGLNRKEDLDARRRLMSVKTSGLYKTQYKGKPAPGFGDPIYIANDVLPQFLNMHRAQSWDAQNKVKPIHGKPDREAIVANHLRLLGKDNTYIETPHGPVVKFRFRWGAAAFNPVALRGVWGQPELFCLTKVFTEDRIRKYVYGEPDKSLLETNGAMRWEKGYIDNLVDIGGVPIGDPKFPVALDLFKHAALGHLPGITQLVESADAFCQSDKGHYGWETGEVARMMKMNISPDGDKPETMAEILAQNGITDYGSWTLWRTDSLVEELLQ